jgi:hypothetical protein
MRKHKHMSHFNIHPMATRNGKIANLPNDIREQLNLRLLEGETGRELAAWLNALPEVQSVLGSQFNGSDISEVNLTHWRQGGYLQWLTERECFDSARALADAECDLAKTGFSADRLLNVLTVRFGQLLMQWDLPPDEGISAAAAFLVMARKARILQGISRSVLAIHRIQSRSARDDSGFATASANSHARSEKSSAASSATAECLAAPPLRGKETRQSSEANGDALAGSKETAESRDCGILGGGKEKAIPKILSGPISSLIVPLKLPQTPFRADLNLSEILDAV